MMFEMDSDFKEEKRFDIDCRDDKKLRCCFRLPYPIARWLAKFNFSEH